MPQAERALLINKCMQSATGISLFFFLILQTNTAFSDIFGKEAMRLEQAAKKTLQQLVGKPHKARLSLDQNAAFLPIANREHENKHQLNSETTKEEFAVLQKNISRWRKVPLVNASRFVLVDIAGFQVYYYSAGKRIYETLALVGSKDTPTPVFQTTIDKVVLNPSWTVPKSIVLKEILPLLLADPDLLPNDISIYKVTNKKLKKVSATSIDWKKIEPDSFPYVFIQRPGGDNPLGNIKFASRNPHSIYLHATPDGELFNAQNRAVSHGCVRLQDSIGLALLLLNENSNNWTRERLTKLIETKQETILPLPQTTPVYFGYWTAWADNDLNYHLRKDVYGWDR